MFNRRDIILRVWCEWDFTTPVVKTRREIERATNGKLPTVTTKQNDHFLAHCAPSCIVDLTAERKFKKMSGNSLLNAT